MNCTCSQCNLVLYHASRGHMRFSCRNIGVFVSFFNILFLAEVAFMMAIIPFSTILERKSPRKTMQNPCENGIQPGFGALSDFFFPCYVKTTWSFARKCICDECMHMTFMWHGIHDGASHEIYSSPEGMLRKIAYFQQQVMHLCTSCYDVIVAFMLVACVCEWVSVCVCVSVCLCAYECIYAWIHIHIYENIACVFIFLSCELSNMH